MGQGPEPDSDGMAVYPDDEGGSSSSSSSSPDGGSSLRRYRNETVVLTLPEDVYNFDWIGIWSKGLQR